MTFLKSMMQSRIWLPTLSLICCLSLVDIAAAQPQTRTQVRYENLYRALEPGLIISSFDRLLARQRIVSRQSEVSPSQIEVRILSTSGAIVVKVAPDGTVNFPMTCLQRIPSWKAIKQKVR